MIYVSTARYLKQRATRLVIPNMLINIVSVMRMPFMGYLTKRDLV